MMSWKRIKSAPRDGENVLITDGASICVAYCDGFDQWRHAWSSAFIVSDIGTQTHWMPLPKLPPVDR